VPHIKSGRVGGGWGGWKGWVGGLMMLVDTADQVVYTVGQTDGHSSSDHTMSQAAIQWNRIGPQSTPLVPLNDLIESVLVLCDLIGLTKGHL